MQVGVHPRCRALGCLGRLHVSMGRGNPVCCLGPPATKYHLSPLHAASCHTPMAAMAAGCTHARLLHCSFPVASGRSKFMAAPRAPGEPEQSAAWLAPGRPRMARGRAPRQLSQTTVPGLGQWGELSSIEGALRTKPMSDMVPRWPLSYLRGGCTFLPLAGFPGLAVP